MGGFIPASEMGRDKADTLKIGGEMGRFIGAIEQYLCAITIEGEQGAGKSRFAWMLANSLAEVGLNVAFLTLETGIHSSVVLSMKDQYLSARGAKKIQVSDTVPASFAELERIGGIFDAIIIDSWQMLGLKQEDFEKLRKACPKCIIVGLFQRTTGGELRGGNRPKFDASINIEVSKRPLAQGGNYAECTKNRYARTGTVFLLETQTQQSDEK